MDDSGTARRDERRVVRRILAGDEQAFDAFFREMFPRLFRFVLAWTRGDEDLAEDVTQATLIRAMSKLGAWRGDAPLFSWLCTIARHEAGALHRKRRDDRTQPLDLVPPGSAGRRSGPDLPVQEAGVMREELRREIHAALDRLPERYARCLEWKYVHALSVREIAGRLGVSEKAAESILVRARLAFRKVFDIERMVGRQPAENGR